MADQVRKIVLYCPNGYRARLDEMVVKWFEENVGFIGVVGEDCERIHDIIDDLTIDYEERTGTTRELVLLTTWHNDETVDDVIEFASSLSDEYEGPVEVVELA